MPPLLIFSINIIFQPSTSILSLPIFFISFSSYFPFSLRFLSPPLLVPPRYFRKGQDEKFTGETWYFFFSLQHSPLLRGKKNSQGILISHFLYNISFPDHPWALSSSTPQPLFATFQPTLAIGAREFFLYSFLFCKTILFTPRLHKLHFYVFFLFFDFFPTFFFLHSRILCEMGKNTLLLCKETLNVPLCVFSILSAFYSQSNFQRENMAAFKIHFAGCEIWRCG